MRRSLAWSYLGRIAYASAWELQQRLRERIQQERDGDYLLLLEHPPVFTLGRNASPDDIIASRAWREEHGVEVHESNRGGQVTVHGPGQLVAYPIVDLNPDRRDVRRYVKDLQEVLIRALGEIGLEGRRRSGQALIGVWVGNAKIASIGVHLSRWVTAHGFALNVSTDLDLFSGIVACGLSDVQMTSVERLTGHRVPLNGVAEVVARHFGEVFERRLVPISARELGL